MKVAKIPENEEERLLYLQSLGLLDTPEEEIYDDITKLAAKITNTPISLISLIDEKRQWFKSHHGLGARETDRELAFCAHAINEDKPFVIRDARKDERFSDNPLATGEPHVIFYAGIQLKLPTGHKLGTLCVIDNHPRDIAPEELELLQILADHVIRLFMLKGKLAFHKLVENAKNAWLAGLSHDLKNPAGAINGFANFIEEELDTLSKEDLSSYLKAILKSSENLLDLIDDIINLSKLESNCIDIHTQKVDVFSVLKTVKSELNFLEKKCNSTISLNLKSEIHCLADSKRLRQVLGNIISNAIRYSYDDSVVEVDCFENEGKTIITVVNQGEGIPRSNLDMIWDKFGKGINQARDTNDSGTGLGLYICKRLIQEMDGEILCESIAKGSTVFTIILPAVE